MKKKIFFVLNIFILLQVYSLQAEEKIRLIKDDEIFPIMTHYISQAQHSIYIGSLHYLIKDNNYPAQLAKQLAQKKKRGLKIKVILNASNRKTNCSSALILKRLGIPVFFVYERSGRYQRLFHPKVVVIDRKYSIVGSHNISQSAFKYNRELSVLLESVELAEELLAYFQEIEQSKVTPTKMCKK